MFCPLVRFELKQSQCPIRCMYKLQMGNCGYEELNADSLSPEVIAEFRGKKAYVIRSEIAQAKKNIAVGLAIDAYTTWIKQEIAETSIQKSVKLSQNSEGGVSEKLQRVFGLGESAQDLFWSEEMFTRWSRESGVQTSLERMRQVLESV